MPKTPISVTLEADNLLWLKGQTASGKRRSLSDTLDALVTAARTGGHGGATSRSIVGTIDIASDDPGLDDADTYVRRELEASLARGVTAHVPRSAYGHARRSATPQRSARKRKPSA